MRSFARARSSSRRAPPNAASNPCCLDRVQQRDGLQPVARRARPGLLDHAAAVDRVLHGRDDQPLAQLGDAAVAELDRLREVVAGVDVHDRERHRAGAERLLGQAQQDDRVLAAGEQQHRALQLGRHLAHDVDRLGLEHLQVRGRLERGHRGASMRRERATQRRHDGQREGDADQHRDRQRQPGLGEQRHPGGRSARSPASARRPLSGSRADSALPIHTPGIEPMRIVPASARSTLPEIRCAIEATHSSTAACDDVGAHHRVRGHAEADDQADGDQRARAGRGDAEHEADRQPERDGGELVARRSSSAASARAGACRPATATAGARAGRSAAAPRRSAPAAGRRTRRRRRRAAGRARRRRSAPRGRSRRASHSAIRRCTIAHASGAGSRRRSWSPPRRRGRSRPRRRA